MNEEQLKAELDAAVKSFKRLRHDSTAVPRYAILQDTIIWQDEVPGAAQFDCMHFLTHIFCFRMEAARRNWEATDPIWTYFQARVPKWPGFRDERCNPRTLIEAYERMRTRGKSRRD